jgi:hypothetical protein
VPTVSHRRVLAKSWANSQAGILPEPSEEQEG